MAVSSSSRYQLSTVGYLQKTADGDTTPILFYIPDELGIVSYLTHTYVERETLHMLSWKYYNRPDFWWVIPEYNPEIKDFLNIEPGTQLRIPRV